jgi:NADH-quinone oxidoreductase subunit E
MKPPSGKGGAPDRVNRIIASYPDPRSAVMPLLYVTSIDHGGHVTDDVQREVAELTGLTAAQVQAVASFYTMYKRDHVGRYLISVCTSISCFLLGGDELLHHAEETLGIKEGATTPDGLFSLEGYECQAACTEAPCLQVNYRYFHNVTTADFDRLVDDLRAGRRSDEIPPHGTLARTRQQIPADRAAGPADPAGAGPPVWLRDEPALRADA